MWKYLKMLLLELIHLHIKKKKGLFMIYSIGLFPCFLFANKAINL